MNRSVGPAALSGLLRRRCAAAGGECSARRRRFSALPPGSARGDSSLEERSSFLADILQRYGFPSLIVAQLLESNRLLLDSDPRDVQRSLNALLAFGISQDSLVSVVSSSPRLLELGFLRRWEIAFSQLAFSPVPPAMAQRILEQSWRSGTDPEDFRRSLQTLTEAGFCEKTVAKVVENLPSLQLSLPGIKSRIGFLEEFGFSKEQIDRIVFSFPRFLALSLEGRLKPLFDEVAELNFADEEVRNNLLANPSVLLTMDLGELHRYVDFLMSLKCRLPIKDRILSEGLIRAAIRVKIRVDFLCCHGLIRRDALKVLWKEPRAILYDLDDIKRKIDFLIHTMRVGMDWLVEVPEYLGVNLEKQVIPRYNVIEHLRSRKALAFQVDLRRLIKPSRTKFESMFVRPYPECEEIFKPRQGDSKTKPRYPTGLWTLLKPPAYPQKREDLRNMKLFMESLGSSS